MSVIAFLGNKGGVGKTTLSVNFASGIINQFNAVLLDADPQGSAVQWHNMSESENKLPVLQAKSVLKKQTQALSKDFDHIVIDCPPYLQSPETASVLKIADIALIPVLPSPLDLWATVHVEEAVEKALKSNPKLKVLLVINQLEVRTTFSKVMRDALSEIKFPVAEASIRRRAIYRNSALEGKSVYDMGKKGSDATAELNELIKEVLSQ